MRNPNDVIVRPAYLDWMPGPAEEILSRAELRLALAWANNENKTLVLNYDHDDSALCASAAKPVQSMWNCGPPPG